MGICDFRCSPLRVVVSIGMTEPEGKVDVITIGSRLPEDTEILMKGEGCEEAMDKLMTNAESTEDGEGNEGREATKDGECKKVSKENDGKRQECVEVQKERRNKYVGMAEYGKEDNKEKTHIKWGKEDGAGEMGEGNDVRRKVTVEENDEREKEVDVEKKTVLDGDKYDEGDEAGKENDSRREDSVESEERKGEVVDMVGAVKEEEIAREGGELEAEEVGAENSVTEEEDNEDEEEISEGNNLTEEDESEDGEEKTDESIKANMLEKKRTYGEEAGEKGNEKGGKPRGSKGQESQRMLVTSAVQCPLRERKSGKRLVRVTDKEQYEKFVIAKGRGIPLRDIGTAEAKSGCGPSWEEMRKVTCEILKRIDLTAVTVKDIVMELGSYFEMDLTPEKSAIKVMIVEELTRLAEEAVENEYGEDELVEGTTSKIFGRKLVKGPRKKRYMHELTATKRRRTEEAEGNKKEMDEDTKNGKRDLSRSSKHQSEEKKDLQKKVFSRRKKKVDAPEETLSSKPDRTGRSSGKRPSTSKGAEASGPSNKELRMKICDILQAVDFNTTTFEEVVRQITDSYQMDLTLKLETIKSIIKNELRRLKEAAKTEQVAAKSSGKRPSTSKGVEASGPSNKELRMTVCDILQTVDFNTTTFGDVVRRITDSYQVDLTLKMETIKSMIKNELGRLKVDAETEQVAAKSPVKR